VNAAKAALLATLRDHLKTNDTTGAIVVRTVSVDGGYGTVEMNAVNIHNGHLKTAALQFCDLVIQGLQACNCGADHALEIAKIKGARQLLNVSESTVLQ
jgi:hypothetical protein